MGNTSSNDGLDRGAGGGDAGGTGAGVMDVVSPQGVATDVRTATVRSAATVGGGGGSEGGGGAGRAATVGASGDGAGMAMGVEGSGRDSASEGERAAEAQGAGGAGVEGADGTVAMREGDDTDAVKGGDAPFEEEVPTVFRWEHGGRQVFITGTFNNWAEKIPMHRSGNDFTYIHLLPKRKHAYKFIVDDEWRFSPSEPSVSDLEGRINNFIDVTQFQPYTGDPTFFDHSKEQLLPASEFSATEFPDFDEYIKEPPLLPPHLRHIILNKQSSEQGDNLSLQTPQSVTVNHLYCTAIKEGMMVLGVTRRYKTKSVTTVFYTRVG